MSLPVEVEASYVTIIDSILAATDLNTISAKKIQKGLQQAVEYDITPQKATIKPLIMSRFEKFFAEQNQRPQTNGHTTPPKEESLDPPDNSTLKITPPPREIKRESPIQTPLPSKKHVEQASDELSTVQDSLAPKKKRKIEHDSDAAYAARLQAQENSRTRSTRGGGPKKAASVKKKTPKKKTASKVKAEDDSELEGSGSEVKEKKVNRSGGFHKELWLSAPLSAVLDNEPKLSRPQTVKRIWAYIRKHDLQDPRDKRMILCDQGLRSVFKQDKVHMFTMHKILNQNLYNMDE